MAEFISIMEILHLIYVIAEITNSGFVHFSGENI